MTRKVLVAAFSVILICFAPLRPLAHESPIDHVDRDIGIWISGDSIFVRYQLQLNERAAMMQLHKMDMDESGTISESERMAFFDQFARQLASQLQLSVAEKNIALGVVSAVELNPQFRQTYTFSGRIGALAKGKTPGKLDDLYSRSYPGNYRLENGEEQLPGPVKVVATEVPRPVDSSGHSGSLRIKFEIIAP